MMRAETLLYSRTALFDIFTNKPIATHSGKLTSKLMHACTLLVADLLIMVRSTIL